VNIYGLFFAGGRERCAGVAAGYKYLYECQSCAVASSQPGEGGRRGFAEWQEGAAAGAEREEELDEHAGTR